MQKMFMMHLNYILEGSEDIHAHFKVRALLIFSFAFVLILPEPSREHSKVVFARVPLYRHAC